MSTTSLSRLKRCILLACAKYRFVTNDQLHLMGLGHAVNIRRATRFLSQHPPKSPHLKCHQFPISPKHGRLANVFTITESGMSLVREMFPHRAIPNNPPTTIFGHDYHHRLAIITFRILLDMALTSSPYRLETSEWYFERVSNASPTTFANSLRSKTRFDFADGSHFIPDGVIVLRNATSDNMAVFAIECVNGRDTARTLRQIRNHQRAIAEGIVSERYALPEKQSFVSLFFFLRANAMPSVLKRLQDQPDFEPYSNNFLFAPFSDLKSNVLGSWRIAMAPEKKYCFITGKTLMNQ